MNADSQLKAAPQSKSSKPPKLREARFEDYPQIAALAGDSGLETEEYPAWAHLWEENPTYLALGGKFPKGWVLEASGGQVVGYLGNVPLSYELQGEKLLAAATRSWVVSSGYRGYSLMLLGPYYQQANVDLFLGTSVNAQSAIACKVFGNVPAPVGSWDRTLFWITHPRGFTESYFAKKGWPLGKPLTYPASFALSLREILRSSAFHNPQLPVLSPDRFDDRFDVFWKQLRRQKANLLLAARDRETLQWHFKFALLNKKAWIFAIEEASGLSAYAVFLRQDRTSVHLTRMRRANAAVRNRFICWS